MSKDDSELSFLRVQDVVALTGLSRSQILKMEKLGQFPRKHKLFDRVTVFVRAEVLDWMRMKINTPAAA